MSNDRNAPNSLPRRGEDRVGGGDKNNTHCQLPAKLLKLTPDVPEQARAAVLSIEDPEQLADFLAPNLNIDTAQKQAILEELDVEKRSRAVQTAISAQLEIAQIQQKLQQDVQSQFSDAQRRAYLREQMKAIQRELGEEIPARD